MGRILLFLIPIVLLVVAWWIFKFVMHAVAAIAVAVIALVIAGIILFKFARRSGP